MALVSEAGSLVPEVPESAFTFAEDQMGSEQAQELVFDLTSFRLKDDASSLPLALPEISFPKICGLYCTQEQNTSLSFSSRGVAFSYNAEM